MDPDVTVGQSMSCPAWLNCVTVRLRESEFDLLYVLSSSCVSEKPGLHLPGETLSLCRDSGASGAEAIGGLKRFNIRWCGRSLRARPRISPVEVAELETRGWLRAGGPPRGENQTPACELAFPQRRLCLRSATKINRIRVTAPTTCIARSRIAPTRYYLGSCIPLPCATGLMVARCRFPWPPTQCAVSYGRLHRPTEVRPIQCRQSRKPHPGPADRR